MNEHPNGEPTSTSTTTQGVVDNQFGLGQHSDRTLLAKRSCGDQESGASEDFGDNFWSDADELAERSSGNISGAEGFLREIFDSRGSPTDDQSQEIFHDGGPNGATGNIQQNGPEISEGGIRGNDGNGPPPITDGGVRGTRNGWHACQFFLTYPRTPHSEGRIAILSMLARLGTQRYLVGFENHSDGSEHIHLYIRFPTQRIIKNEDYFDIDCGCKHPNIQTVRSFTRVASYIAKGGVFEHVGFTPDEVRTFTAKRRTKNRVSLTKTVGERLLGGERIESIAKEWPELICKDIQRFQKNADMVRSYQPELNKRILEKISIFNLDYQFDPAKKCRGPNGNLHLWIYGEPGCGKSTIFQNLSEEWRIYFVSDGTNWVGFDSDQFDCIVFDEVTPTTLTHTGFHVLNTILDGRPTQLNSKGGAGGIGSQKFSKSMPIIFISNWNCLDIKIENNPSFSAFCSRLRIIEISRNRNMNVQQYSTARDINNPTWID